MDIMRVLTRRRLITGLVAVSLLTACQDAPVATLDARVINP